MHKRTNVPAMIGALLLCGGCQPSSFYYNCHDGDEIQPSKRAEIAANSLQYARAVFAGNVDLAYKQFTDEARKNTSQEQLQNFMGTILKPFGPHDGFKIERILTVTGWGVMSASTSVAVCSGGSNRAGSGVTVTIKNAPEQAYALVTAKGAQETWVAVLWLIPDGGSWRVHAFHVTAATALGKSADDILAEARRERNLGHNLNAEVLYAGAAGVASRGPFYRMALQDLIQEEMQQVIPPEGLRGQPPFILQGPGGPFTVQRLGPLVVGGKFYLVVAQEVTPWEDSQEVERENQALIRLFAQRFPEYSAIFAGIIAEATERNGTRGWRTVEENSPNLKRQPVPRVHE